MWRGMIKVAAATTAFGLLHSALASRAAKRAAVSVVGERNRNGLYRVFYIGQSLASFALLAAYIRRQPGRELYRIHGPIVIIMHAGQIAAILYATAAARQVGIRRIVGWQSVEAWSGNGTVVPAEPEAQGPALDHHACQRAAGPFATSRHPLNLAPLVIFWLWPRMTTNFLAFNAVTTVYLMLGSLHEESRLSVAYGDRYAAYQRSGVPFYFPTRVTGTTRALMPPSRQIAERDEAVVGDERHG